MNFLFPLFLWLFLFPHLTHPKQLPYVVDAPIERIERGKHGKTQWESEHNHKALNARLEWVHKQNARLRADGVIWITEKKKHTRKHHKT